MANQQRQHRSRSRRDFLRSSSAAILSLAAASTSLAACDDPRLSTEPDPEAFPREPTPGQDADSTLDAQPLPPPSPSGSLSLEETLAARRSVRSYEAKALTWEEIGQLLWAAQGVTLTRTPPAQSFRSAPSAGALYPLETYVVTSTGSYHYLPADHSVIPNPKLRLHQELWEAGLKQDWIREAPAVFVIAAVYRRSAQKYGARAARYVHMEAGHAAENLLLQAVALGLGGVVIGAFHDEKVQEVLDLPEQQEPLYLIPVGHPKE